MDYILGYMDVQQLHHPSLAKGSSVLLFILFYYLINFSENANPHHSRSLFAKIDYSLKLNGVSIHVFFNINIYLNLAWSAKIYIYTIYHLE